MNILVVEDDEDVREMIVFLLHDLKHTVLETGLGKEAIHLAQKESLDLVFSDVGLPDISGWDVVKKIRKTNRKIPIYLITGFESEKDVRDAIAFRITATLIKPFSLEKLEEIIEKEQKIIKPPPR